MCNLINTHLHAHTPARDVENDRDLGGRSIKNVDKRV